jgi:ankyrin repeat protein
MEKMKLLVSAGAGPNSVCGSPDSMLQFVWESDKGWGTALHGAASKNEIECIRFLLEAGATEDVKDAWGLGSSRYCKGDWR